MDELCIGVTSSMGPLRVPMPPMRAQPEAPGGEAAVG